MSRFANPRVCHSAPSQDGVPRFASRSPNYFFEWCFWVDLAIYGLAFAPAGLIALVGQAIILGSILGVTGIPPTESQALRSKGEAYRAYQKRVSRFVPMPPKSRSNDA